MVRESLEILDGIKSLVKGSSVNVIEILLRNLFENMIYFDYIFKDKNLIEKKSLAYNIDSIYKKIDLYKKLNINNNSKSSYKSIVGEEFVKGFDSNDLENRVKNLELIFDKYDEYKQVNLDRNNKKIKLENDIRKNKGKKVNINLKWYQIYGESRSFRDLCREVDMEKYYLILYKEWSDKVHVGVAMKGIYTDNNQVFIRNPKIPKDINTIPNVISFSLTFMGSIFNCITTYYLGDEDQCNMEKWNFNMRKKEKQLSKYWRAIKFVTE